ncbi:MULTISPECIES: DUF4124 domain-containing protein [Aeromonas]|jgi:hypothetical protein|uniref:DUF4124 domain-containing protein n=1 Tax=Aeromonas TaxID=642 RepID=UPI0005B20208|nr:MULTISPECIES: DUF4124 domain-containing protein [Aeromonas]MBS4640599.1 DUF4124 domain-containing protein [Aeromonas media]MDM5124071.1 DUF4124 domain-containing protein [Aeromonas rivipollensis]
MSRVLIISLGCLVAATTLVARADVYQCTRNGNITFSDIPCTGDSEPVRMNVFIPSAEEVERANKRTRDIEENLASSRQQRQLEALHPEMGAKDQKMNPEMTRFSEGQSDSTTSETGETRRLDVPAVTRQYQDEMEALNKRLSTLKEK